MNKYRIIIIFTMGIIAINANAGFQANYDVIFDGDSYPPFVIDDIHMNLDTVKYSKNSNRIIFYGRIWQNNSPYATLGFRAFVIDFDGTNLREVPLPQRDDGFTGALELNSIAINDDGTLAYFGTYGTTQSSTGGTYSIPDKLYKIEISDFSDPVIVSKISIVTDQDFRGVQTTSSGDWIYYYDSKEHLGGDDFIYRVTSAGSIPQIIVQDDTLQLTIGSTGCSGRGEHISENFSVSGDGSKILFQIADIYNDSEYCAFSQFYWAMYSSTGTQTLNPENVIGASGGVVSTDGSKVVIADDDNYHSYDGDGSNQLSIQSQSYNYQGPSMTSDGSKYFYADNNQVHGLILNTNGTGAMPVFPKGTSIAFPAINNTGDLLVFSSGRRIYAGALFDNDNNSSAPNVGITFNPPYIIEGNTDPVAILINAQAAVGEIAEVDIYHMKASVYAPYDADFSHYFFYPVDSGFHGDEVAGDGIYTDFSGIWNNGDINNPVPSHIRVTVTDTLGNVKIIEKILNIGIYSNGFE